MPQPPHLDAASWLKSPGSQAIGEGERDALVMCPPVLVPLLSLGQRVVATEGSGARASTFYMQTAEVAAGGQELRVTNLSSSLFEAAAMKAVSKDLMHMKVVDELKVELEERGEIKTGNKAWLRRRLHAAIMREYLEGA